MGDQIWQQLVAAHGQAAGRSIDRSVNRSIGEVPAHEPKAAILGCSDARVPPSVIFDQPAGALFVVRLAGNTASPAALASLDYAVATLGVDLIVVLGHTGCGAVQAAAGGTCGGHLAPVVAPICALARSWPDAEVDQLVRHNVVNTVDELNSHDGPVGHRSRAGHLTVRGAVHDLRSGRLESLDLSDPLESLKPLEQTTRLPASLEAT